MVEVTIDSIRVSLMSQHRVVILKDTTSDRYLPIWIGPFEADAITVELQQMPLSRPMTHDLLKNTIQELGAKVNYIIVSALRDDIFYAELVLSVNGKEISIDSRPSDAIALAVRARAPIYVEESVMQSAAVTPDEDVEADDTVASLEPDNEELSIFQDFVDTLDMDDLENNE
ncbi:MAG: bifunctional nuclease family protein [Anaerolineae bacterium]|nr:bifunctional nuclease family protein [Anaerolineae bacterium]